jgi:hypothetical protein
LASFADQTAPADERAPRKRRLLNIAQADEQGLYRDVEDGEWPDRVNGERVELGVALDTTAERRG